jgi:hypothetical protein
MLALVLSEVEHPNGRGQGGFVLAFCVRAAALGVASISSATTPMRRTAQRVPIA